MGNTQINTLKELKTKVENQFNSSPLILNQNRTNNELQDTNSQSEMNMLSEIEIKQQLDEAKGLFKRVFKKNLSLKVFQYHMLNGTAPKEISIHNFPPPFLSHDKEFVEEYDKLIKSFQTQIMELCIKRASQQVDTFQEKISNIKTYLSAKNVQDVDSKLTNIKSNVENTWKLINEKALEKAQRLVIKPFVVQCYKVL